ASGARGSHEDVTSLRRLDISRCARSELRGPASRSRSAGHSPGRHPSNGDASVGAQPSRRRGGPSGTSRKTQSLNGLVDRTTRGGKGPYLSDDQREGSSIRRGQVGSWRPSGSISPPGARDGGADARAWVTLE